MREYTLKDYPTSVEQTIQQMLKSVDYTHEGYARDNSVVWILRIADHNTCTLFEIACSEYILVVREVV